MSIHVRTSHIIVTAIAALALVFGMGAAGAVAGQKWINGHDIKPNSIPANRIQKGSVSGKQIKARTLTKRALTRAAVDQLQTTPVTYVDHTFDVAAGSSEHWVNATCPAGTQAVAGYVEPGATAFAIFNESYIDPDANALRIKVANSGGSDGQVTIQTICVG